MPDDQMVSVGSVSTRIMPMWPEDPKECDGTHPAKVATTGSVMNMYDLVSHCQPWARPAD
jgi:hypothetical protein